MIIDEMLRCGADVRRIATSPTEMANGGSVVRWRSNVRCGQVGTA